MTMNWVGAIKTAANRLAIFASGCLLLSANIDVSAQNDPALIQALQQETHDQNTNTTDLQSLVWLSSMSSRLESRIPNPFYRVRLLSAIHQEALAEGLDPQLVLAVIEVESNFNRNALSSAGAQGLMQVMPFWKEVIGDKQDDLYNPLTSLRYGCKILRHYLDRHKDPADALAAYNGSLGRYVYPNKVYDSLKKRWQFQAVDYPGGNRQNIATTELQRYPTDRLILN